jgi:hypothetical protein
MRGIRTCCRRQVLAFAEDHGHAGPCPSPIKLEPRNRGLPFVVEEVQLPREAYVSILWIILIVVLVLVLLGFVGR